MINEIGQVICGQRGIVVDLTVLALGGGPRFPAIGLVKDVRVFLAIEGGFGRFVVFECVEVFEEEQPRGLLGVVEFAGAAGIFPENVVDIFEGLFEHGRQILEKNARKNQDLPTIIHKMSS